jgi:DNA-binding transcriptional regulator YhcF (GntR family)
MQFRKSSAIYLQITEYVCEKILLGEWAPEGRIPSVRELAVQLEVNPNTVMRAYEFLQKKEIIFNQRGVGFFVGAQALRHATEHRLQVFMEKELPQLFRSMWLLEISQEELNQLFEKYKSQLLHRE